MAARRRITLSQLLPANPEQREFLRRLYIAGSAPALTVSTNDGGFGDFAAQFSTSSLSAGTHTITATYADINYALSTSNAQTVFVGGTPTLTWAAPAAITYGTALSATQLNATDTIPAAMYIYRRRERFRAWAHRR